jgi:uncharacterized pyridoxamine 5'-phosphate oxidase family protein
LYRPTITSAKGNASISLQADQREETMRIVDELKSTGVFYVTTVEGDQPHVRPFSSVCEYEGNAYLCTNNTKKVYAQIMNNAKAEISGMAKDGTWLRIQTKLVRDDRDEVRKAMLEDLTGPKNLYHIGDGIFEVLKLTEIDAVKYSFTAAPEKIV